MMAAAWRRLSSIERPRPSAVYGVTSCITPSQRSFGTACTFRALLRRMHDSQKMRKIVPRSFTSSILIQILTPPCVFSGLVVTLWLYKCLMLVLFQNRIIYMPSIPPFSRSERLLDYQASCKPVHWKHHFIRSSDGVRLSILEGEVLKDSTVPLRENKQRNTIVYFQG